MQMITAQANAGTTYGKLLFPDHDRLPYYIFAPGYVRQSAGVRVLHILCHMLNMSGQSAFMITSVVDPDLLTPLLTERIADEHYRQGRTPIVLYPEIVHGNPLNASCVVRYILNYPGILGGPYKFESSELLVWYTEQMRKEEAGEGVVLSIPACDTRIFYPPPAGSKRSGTCYWARKIRQFSPDQARELERSPLLRGSFEIPSDDYTHEQIAALFRRSELFYCYESSALWLEAVLCGCPAVLVADNFFGKLIIADLIGLTGAAWGTAPEEVERARQSVGQMPEKYELWIQKAVSELDGFIHLTQLKARQIEYGKQIHLVNPWDPTSPWGKTLTVRRRYCNAWRALLGRPLKYTE